MKLPFNLSKSTQIVSTGDGTASQYFFNWLTFVQALLGGTLAKGYTGTITTAKLTTGGTEGSITFTNGVVTAQTAAT